MKQYNLLELLDYINPSELSYQEWTNVGMALKHEGYEASDWDSWSSQDSERYKRESASQNGIPSIKRQGILLQVEQSLIMLKKVVSFLQKK